MKKKIIYFLIAAALCLAITFVVNAQTAADNIKIKTVEAKTVLYTIFRGHYSRVGESIGKLYALAGQKGIRPCGSLCMVYLNNPRQVSAEHWLVEIQIPVSRDTLELTGTLGNMTDVKQLPEMKTAVITRQNIMADPTELYDRLYDWICTQDFRPIDNAFETFDNFTKDADYSQIKSEIMVPVK